MTIVLATSCSTDDEEQGCTDESAINYNPDATEDDGNCEYESGADSPENITPVFTGDHAALIGIKTITTIDQFGFEFNQEFGVAVAVFNEGGELLNAGSVTCEDESLSLQSNDSYVFTPTASNFTGIEFVGSTNWSVSGAEWPQATLVNNDAFSEVGVLNSATTVSSSSDFTVSTESMNGADSVYFMLYGSDNFLLKALEGNPTTYTFTADEVATIGAGSGYAQVVGLTYNEQTSDGRTYWLINETVRTETVTIE